jgi:peptidoglycan/xylan/chitin deacetylase (PgdA/CDA1 family)
MNMNENVVRYVALTFDDGPSPYTHQILDILKRYSIPATFFVVGSEAHKFPDIIRRICSEGHVIGNHTWSHPDITSLSCDELLKEIYSTNFQIHNLIGRSPDLFRPPHGSMNDHTSAVIKEAGMTSVLWNVSSEDWYEGSLSVDQNVITSLQENSIILMHDGDQHGSGPRDKTVIALPIIIEHLIRNGYRFITVPEFHQVAFRIERPLSLKVKRGVNMDRFSPDPVSRNFGYDRGKPIDRFYMENFLNRHRSLITGSVLEVGDNNYTMGFGHDVTSSDVLNLIPSPQATIVGNLATGENIPECRFDCIILTQVIQLIYDVKSAIRHAWKALKPGGTMLLTVPGISKMCDWDHYNDFWRFTHHSLKNLLEESAPNSSVLVEAFGNVAIAKAVLDGLALHEVPHELLEYQDPDFEVILTGMVTKQ